MNKHGSTLLELLISLTLLVLIVLITMGSMSLTSRAVTAGERRMDGQERLRAVMSLMNAQVQSQMPLTYEANGEKVNYFQGDSKTLQLATNNSVWGARPGYLLVNYRIEPDERGKLTLYVREQTMGIEGASDVRLLTDASEIDFDYFGKGANEEIATWSYQWNDKTEVPELVRMKVNYGTKKLFFLFPVRAQGKSSASVAVTPTSIPATTPALTQPATPSPGIFRSVR